MYIKTTELNRLVSVLERKGYTLDGFNDSREGAVGIYTYNDKTHGIRTYGFLKGYMCVDDERTSWICHRHECLTEEEFIKGL